MGIVVSFILWNLGALQNLYLLNRFNSLITLTEVGGMSSLDVRKDFLSTVMDNFSYHPFFGSGLGDFRVMYGSVTHNEYFFFLNDLGLVGLLFVCIQLYIIYLLVLSRKPLYLVLIFYVNFLFVNGYNSMFIWFFLVIIFHSCFSINRERKCRIVGFVDFSSQVTYDMTTVIKQMRFYGFGWARWLWCLC